MNITNVARTLLLLGFSTLLASQANAVGDYDGAVYNFKESYGHKYLKCKIEPQSSIDFCSSVINKKIDELAKRKPNYGKSSVLMRFWDAERNYWIYTALDKKTNKVWFYPRALKAINGNPRSVKVSLANNQICTIGNNVSLIGDYSYKSFDDDYDDVDFCTEYSEKNGFEMTIEVDAKTKKATGNPMYL